MSKTLSKRRNFSRRIAGVVMPIKRKRIKWSRNWPCLCGSGKKYKNCCMKEMDALTVSDDNADIEALPEDIQKMIETHRGAQGKGKVGTNG